MIMPVTVIGRPSEAPQGSNIANRRTGRRTLGVVGGAISQASGESDRDCGLADGRF